MSSVEFKKTKLKYPQNSTGDLRCHQSTSLNGYP
ncbi:hypothetical protein NSIN_30270 [Nitrosotalea sinensis]|uniref:Uncharacterized protein n=1 Tax=Nitrosotalea sinensis TaxID=1499975 RepID=A0A2H1EHZ6_9ARCH|nr:hypothetical protein NSIN_30270 [Candidatus Nitrosotalea sinensis]